ncbi:MAG: MATE family efflux transporter [Eubacteriaceae bacterium]|nr:MATE family efflux transporter [Eubacteriaceae bacterium]
MSEITEKNKMGVMPVGRLLIGMSWPAIISMTIQALYNVVDSLFIAQTGEEGLTAITLIFPVQMLMIALGVGTGIGVNSLISRRLGARRYEEADKTASIGFKISFVNWVIFAVFGLLFAKPFIALFTENQSIITAGAHYLKIITIGCIFMMIQMSCEKILQSTGNMIIPMMTNMIGAVTNIILDPILIFGLLGAPKMGIIGAAVATVIGQALSMTVVVILLFKKNHAVKIDLKQKFEKQTLKEIYAVGGPSIVMQAIASVLNLGMNGILSGFSDTAVAVMGVYGRLQSFIFMPVFGINQGAMPILGFNYGARNRKRLMKAFKLAVIMAAVIMGIGLVLFQSIPGIFLSWFNASEDMMRLGIPAFRAISLCFIPAAFGIVTSGLFGATGHGFISLMGALIRQLIGALPLAWIFARIGGATLVWWAFPAAEVLGLVYCIIMVRYIYRKDIIKLDDAV